MTTQDQTPSDRGGPEESQSVSPPTTLDGVHERLENMNAVILKLSSSISKIDMTQKQLFAALKSGLTKRRQFATEVEQRLDQFDNELSQHRSTQTNFIETSIETTKNRSNEVFQHCQVLVDELQEQVQAASLDYSNLFEETRSTSRRNKGEFSRMFKKLEKKLNDDLDGIDTRFRTIESKKKQTSNTVDSKQLRVIYSTLQVQKATLVALQVQHKSEFKLLSTQLNDISAAVRQAHYSQTLDRIAGKSYTAVSPSWSILSIFLFIVFGYLLSIAWGETSANFV